MLRDWLKHHREKLIDEAPRKAFWYVCGFAIIAITAVFPSVRVWLMTPVNFTNGALLVSVALCLLLTWLLTSHWHMKKRIAAMESRLDEQPVAARDDGCLPQPALTTHDLAVLKLLVSQARQLSGAEMVANLKLGRPRILLACEKLQQRGMAYACGLIKISMAPDDFLYEASTAGRAFAEQEGWLD